MTTALVLSGGGMFAAWEAGVWKALREHVHFDMIVGASAGAWVGWAIAGGCTADELECEWLHPSTARIMQPGLSRSSLLRPEGLHDKARELFQRFQPRMPYALTVVEWPRARMRFVRDTEIRWQHLAATASIPFCFPPIAIGGRRYVDGGFPASPLPLWVAEAMGADRAIGLLCLNLPLLRVLHRVAPHRRPSRTFPVHTIVPSENLGGVRDAGIWNARNIACWIALGERDGTRALHSITM